MDNCMWTLFTNVSVHADKNNTFDYMKGSANLPVFN